jgi:hypothetical protein
MVTAAAAQSAITFFSSRRTNISRLIWPPIF